MIPELASLAAGSTLAFCASSLASKWNSKAFGIYMLFVLDTNGVPSMARKVHIRPESRGRSLEFK